MAQLNTRGTLTRSRWDYFESSDGWAFVDASVPSGVLGCYLANNSTGATSLDVYSMEFSATVATTWWAIVFVPPLILTPVTPIVTGISPIQTDHAAIPGALGAYNAIASNFIRIARFAAPTNTILLNPLGNMTFISLPPGWALSAFADPVVSTQEVGMTVWYQEVLDNISPAR